MVGYHFLLCIISTWALERTSQERTIAKGCFIFLITHSILGMLFYQSRRIREDITMEISTCVAETAPHSLINAQLYTLLGRPDIGSIHKLTAIIPISFKLYSGDVDNEIINSLQILNIISSLHLAIQKDNIWCCLIAVNQFIFNRTFHHFDEDQLNFIAAGLCLFTIAAVKSIENFEK